jgi:hypothetical protein
MLWEKKYKEEYDLICNKLFPTLYQMQFSEEAPCLSPLGQKIVKEYRDWYMTPIGVYIIISGSAKPPHWLPHLVPDSYYLKRSLIKPLLIVWLHPSIETRKDFGLNFH